MPSPALRGRGRGLSNTDLAGQLDQVLAGAQHVVERAEGVHVVAGKSCALDPLEHIRKLEVTGARLQMDFVSVAEAISEPYFLDAANVDRIDKADNPFRDALRMVDGEGKLECRRLDGFEVKSPLLGRMSEIMDLGIRRLFVQIFEQNERTLFLRVVDDPFEAL